MDGLHSMHKAYIAGTETARRWMARTVVHVRLIAHALPNKYVSTTNVLLYDF